MNKLSLIVAVGLLAYVLIDGASKHVLEVEHPTAEATDRIAEVTGDSKVEISGTAVQGDDDQGDLEGVQMVSFAAGITGFLDPKEKMLYLYDGDLVKCIAKRQIIELGKDFKKVGEK